MSEIAQPEALPVPDVTAGWGTDTFALKHPFRFANVVYSGLTLRVPTGADMAAFLTGKDMSFRTLALRLVEADERLLDAMHGSDYARLMSSMGEYLAGVR